MMLYTIRNAKFGSKLLFFLNAWAAMEIVASVERFA
jgi:hypothetical protein